MESAWSAQDQLDALERDREQLRTRLLLPWWHHVGWGVTWCIFSVGTVTVSSNWIFLIYGCTFAAFVALGHARVRMQGLRLAPPRAPLWKQFLHVAAGAAVALGLIVLTWAVDSGWPLVVGNVALGVVLVLSSMHEDRRQLTRLRDER